MTYSEDTADGIKPHLEEGQGNPEQDLGALEEQDIPDAHSRLSGQGGAEQAAEPAPGDLLQPAPHQSVLRPSHLVIRH